MNQYSISWDSSATGQIMDGGNDMYDGGNQITTSLCGSHLAPYTDDMELVTSDCFGFGGSYMMDIRSSMMMLLSQNSGNTDLTLSISGNLGADGGGSYSASEYSSGSFVGYTTSTCNAFGESSATNGPGHCMSCTPTSLNC